MKKIIITGGSGFLGTQIAKELLSRGRYEIVVMDLVPPRIENQNVSFFKKNLLDTFTNDSSLDLLEKPYAVVHLSGKNIFGRFTKKHKQLVYDSRVTGTYNLVKLFEDPLYRPEYFICASAVGYYGDQPDQTLTESSERKNHYFLSEVVRQWEVAAGSARKYGVKVSCIRNGHIIGKGGIAKAVAGHIKFGVASILGTGREHFPWIDIRDLVPLYLAPLGREKNPRLINGVSMAHDTQESFARAIGRRKKAWLYINVPQWLLSLRFGSFGKEMLVDQEIQSEVFADIDFAPKHQDISTSINYHL